MADAETTIRQLLYHYPTLPGCRDRLGILAHLLCTIGNGYDWQGGELVCDDDFEARERERPLHTDPELAYQQELKEWQERVIDPLVTEVMDDSIRAYATRRAERVAYVRGHLEELAERREQPTHIYPMSEKYSALLTIPDDVTGSWLAACEEVAKAVLVAPCSLYGPPPDAAAPTTDEGRQERRAMLAADAKAVAENRRLARTALVRIAAIRQVRGTELV